jgi:hypothetical protein
MGGKLQKSHISEEVFILLVMNLMEVLQVDELEKWAVTTWSLWNARNKFIHEGIQSQPESIVDREASLRSDFQKFSSKPKGARAHGSRNSV